MKYTMFFLFIYNYYHVKIDKPTEKIWEILMNKIHYTLYIIEIEEQKMKI